MAEGLASHLGGNLVEASSAGLFPAPIVQPETFQVMAERGMPLDPSHTPRNILLVEGSAVDVLVNMSGQPAVRLLNGFQGRRVEWEVQDPIGMHIQVYRAVRDIIEDRVRELISQVQRER